jgi:Spy/CpxP family protein refolding chaperone
MKVKSLPVLAVTLAGTALMVAACKSPSSPTQEGSASSVPAQKSEMPDTPASPSMGANRSMPSAPLPPDLKLTDKQKTQLKQIQEKYRSKMETVLTDKQKNELKAAQEQGKDPRTLMQSLNITDAQKQQIQNLRQSQFKEIANVLTDEQKQQLQKTWQSRQQRPQQEGNGAPKGQ